MRRLFLFACFSLLFLSCNNSNETPIDDAVNLRTPEQKMMSSDSSLVKRTFKTATGKDILVQIAQGEGEDKPTISIIPQNFAKGIALNYRRADSMTNILQGDLDQDGFDEIYIVTRSNKDDDTLNKGHLIAIASDKDEQLVPIIFIDSIPQGLPAGMVYQGNDAYSIRNQYLIRTFPLSDATTKKETGEIFEINYTLKPQSGKWFLERVKAGIRK